MKIREKKLIILLAAFISISLFSLISIQKELNSKYPQLTDKPKIETPIINPTPIQEKKVKDKNRIEIKFHSAFFYPQDKAFRKLYGSGYLSSLEFDFPIYKNLYIWTDVGFFHKERKLKELNQEVKHKITQVPLNLGLLYSYPINSYFSIGGKFGANYLYSDENATFPASVLTSKKHFFGFTVGAFGKVTLKCGFLLDAFINYRYNSKKLHDESSDHIYLGGLEVGAGIGYRF